MTPHRREIAAVSLATLAGLVLRAWDLPRLGLDHFDEGIYALGGLWIASPKGLAALDPGLIPYAPPLQPLLIGLSYLLLGVSDTAAILVAIAAGTATIPVAAWLARRTFAPGAGAAAAWLCALSGPHVAFSRTALTDSVALLTFLLALGLGMRFLERPGVVRAVLFGLAVGLAQNAKYNGFLAGVAVAAAWGVGLMIRASGGRQPPDAPARGSSPNQPALAGRSPLGTLLLGLLAAGVAAACYWPWFAFVQAQPGGYAGLIRHHRSYVMGVGAWPSNLNQQLAQSHALAGRLSGLISWTTVAAGLGIASLAIARDSRPSARTLIAVLAGAALLGLLPTLTFVLSLAVCGIGLFSGSIPRRVLAVSWGMFALLVPLYHPYARLWLPLEALGWIVVTPVFVELLALTARGPRRRDLPWPRLAVGAASLLLATLWAFGPWPNPVLSPFLLNRRDALRQQVTRVVAEEIPGRTTDGIWENRRLATRYCVLARPALIFYLATLDDLPVSRLASLADLTAGVGDEPVAAIDELVIRSNPRELERYAAWSDGRVTSVPVSFVTLLDADPNAAFGRTLIGGPVEPTSGGQPQPVWATRWDGPLPPGKARDIPQSSLMWFWMKPLKRGRQPTP